MLSVGRRRFSLIWRWPLRLSNNLLVYIVNHDTRADKHFSATMRIAICKGCWVSRTFTEDILNGHLYSILPDDEIFECRFYHFFRHHSEFVRD